MDDGTPAQEHQNSTLKLESVDILIVEVLKMSTPTAASVVIRQESVNPGLHIAHIRAKTSI